MIKRNFSKCGGTTIIVHSETDQMRCVCLICRRNRNSERRDSANIADRMYWRNAGLSMAYLIQLETDFYEMNTGKCDAVS